MNDPIKMPYGIFSSVVPTDEPLLEHEKWPKASSHQSTSQTDEPLLRPVAERGGFEDFSKSGNVEKSRKE